MKLKVFQDGETNSLLLKSLKEEVKDLGEKMYN